MQGQYIVPEHSEEIIVVTRESLLLFFLGLAFVSAAFLITMAVVF
jgi:hypothetical protein